MDEVQDGGGAVGEDWPTVAGGLGGSTDWAEVEPVVAQLLARLHRPLVDGEGLRLAYLPYTDLGREDGHDLSWEAQVNLLASWAADADPKVRIVAVGLGAEPAPAVQELVAGAVTPHPHNLRSDPEGCRVAQQRLAGASSSEAVPDALRLVQEWTGWGTWLRRVAQFAASRPASAFEPSDAGFDLTVAWNDGRWLWTVEREMPEVDGQPTGFREWSAANPAGALRAAWKARASWYALPSE